jgi:hypothetical protein
MVEQLFIHKPKIYPFSIIFSLSSCMGVALSLSLPQHFAPQTAKQIGAYLVIWSKLVKEGHYGGDFITGVISLQL